MATTDDPDKFESRWNSHIEQLKGLKQSMSLEQFEDGMNDDLDEHIEELEEIVEATADNFREE